MKKDKRNIVKGNTDSKPIDLESIELIDVIGGRGEYFKKPFDCDAFAAALDLIVNQKMKKRDALVKCGFAKFASNGIFAEMRRAKESGKYKTWREYFSGEREFRKNQMRVIKKESR